MTNKKHLRSISTFAARAGMLAVLFALTFAGCASMDALSDTNEVTWNEAEQVCYHSDTAVEFTSGAGYDSCLALAGAVADDTLVIDPALADGVDFTAVSSKPAQEGPAQFQDICCAEICTVTPSGMTCSGTVCVAC